eukprot:scaffold449707_cov53-Prasinocladus_malaysianus.AAC.2
MPNELVDDTVGLHDWWACVPADASSKRPPHALMIMGVLYGPSSFQITGLSKLLLLLANFPVLDTWHNRV